MQRTIQSEWTNLYFNSSPEINFIWTRWFEFQKWLIPTFMYEHILHNSIEQSTMIKIYLTTFLIINFQWFVVRHKHCQMCVGQNELPGVEYASNIRNLQSVRRPWSHMDTIFWQHKAPTKMSTAKGSNFSQLYTFFFNQNMNICLSFRQQGVHKIINGTFDLETIARIPLEPTLFIVNISLFEIIVDTKLKQRRNRQLFCLDAEVLLTQSKARRIPKF